MGSLFKYYPMDVMRDGLVTHTNGNDIRHKSPSHVGLMLHANVGVFAVRASYSHIVSSRSVIMVTTQIYTTLMGIMLSTHRCKCKHFQQRQVSTVTYILLKQNIKFYNL